MRWMDPVVGLGNGSLAARVVGTCGHVLACALHDRPYHALRSQHATAPEFGCDKKFLSACSPWRKAARNQRDRRSATLASKGAIGTSHAEVLHRVCAARFCECVHARRTCPAVSTTTSVPRLAVQHMVDDPAKVRRQLPRRLRLAKASAAAKKDDGDSGEEETEEAKTAREAKEAEEEAKKEAAEEEAKKKAAAEAKRKAEEKAAAEKAEAVACFSDPALVLTPRFGAPPASVNERADSAEKGIPDAAVKAALKEVGQEEIPYERDYFGNIIAPTIIEQAIYKRVRADGCSRKG